MKFPGGLAGSGCSIITSVAHIQSLSGELPCALSAAKKKKNSSHRGYKNELTCSRVRTVLAPVTDHCLFSQILVFFVSFPYSVSITHHPPLHRASCGGGKIFKEDNPTCNSSFLRPPLWGLILGVYTSG